MNPDFLDVVRLLHNAGARFLVVGAHALAAHGIPRATGDLDIWVQATPENARVVWRALADFGAPLEALGIHEEDFAEGGNVVQFGTPPRRIDLLTAIDGVTFACAWARRVVRAIAGVAFPFLSRDDLLDNKRAAGRPKDLLDVALLTGAPASGPDGTNP